MNKTITAPEQSGELLRAGKILTITGDALVELLKRGVKDGPISIKGSQQFGPLSHDVQLIVSAVNGDVSLIYGVPNLELMTENNFFIDQYIASAPANIAFPSPYVATQGDSAMHPCVLIAPNDVRWNGYKYWGAFTPYPSGVSDYENPCVVASNDLVTWVAPTTNPITEKPATGYNADPHLCWSADGETLFLFYRKRDSAGSDLVFKYTLDGVYWSDEKIALHGIQGIKDFACPSVFYDASIKKYRIIWHDLDDSNNAWPIWTITADSPLSVVSDASKVRVNIVPDTNRQWWHSWFGMLNGRYGCAIMDNSGTAGGSGNIFIGSSLDCINWDVRKLSDGGGLYRPALIPAENKIIISKSTSPSYVASISQARTEKATDRADFIISALSGYINGTVVRDSFNRPDSALSPGNTDNGLAYTVSGGGIAGISSGQLYNVNANNTRALLNAGVANFTLYSRLKNSAGTSQGWIWFRASDTSNFIRLGVSSSALKLEVYQAGSLVVSLSTILNPDVRDFDVKIVALGQRVVIEIDDNVIFNELLNYQLNATQIGLQFSGSTTYADYLIVVK